MRDLLLVSTSTVYGSGYLDACEAQVKALFKGRERLLFVPWALHDLDRYARTAIDRFAAMGFSMTSIHEADDPVAAVRTADGMFIGGGNTFRLVDRLHRAAVIPVIRERALAGDLPYMGTSAGSNVACPTLKTTNDMPIVQPPSFDTIGLVPFQINPHYLDPDPHSTHMGETRETRIREFHEMNETPVIGLREGAMLRIKGLSLVLQGTRGARLFRAGEDPTEHLPGEELNELLEDAD